MLADGLGFDSGVIPGIFEKTITVTNTHDSGAGSLRNAVAPSPDESTESFNGSNGVLTVAASTFSGAGEGPDTLAEYFNGSNGVLTVAGAEEDILNRGVYSEASSYFTITAGNDNDVFFATTRDRLIGTFGSNDQYFATTRDRLIGTFGGHDTISYYEMAEPTKIHSSIIDTLGGNGSSGSDGADTLLASYSGGNGSSESDGADTLVAGYYADNGSSDGKKLKQLRPLGQQLFPSQEESGETIPVASDITLTSEPPVFERTITVTNTNDRGPGSLRNAVAPSQDGSNESATQDILTGGGYPEVSSYGIIDTGNGNDSVFRSTLGIINTRNNGDSIAPSGDQGIGTNFITGGNGRDSLVGNGQDTVFGDERLDILIGNYSEPSRGETEQFYGFPGLSISGNNTSRVTSTGDGYSDDNNSLESNYRATLYGGPGEDLFNARSDSSSPLPLPPTNQSLVFTDAIEDKPSFQFNGFPGLSAISRNNTSRVIL